MWKTGHSLIKEKIKEVNAPFGGELSGHIFFSDDNYGYDDALYAALKVCKILDSSKKTIPQLLEDFPSGFSTPEIRIDTTEARKHEIVSRIKEHFASKNEYPLNLIDGVRISFKTGWALVRASNTQPVIVFRFEESSPEKLQERISQFNSLLEGLLPEPLEHYLS
jgi:phosphomannomutase/phosphomannomutase/phosphoglucomutase